MVRKINLEKRKKFFSIVKKIIGVGVFITVIPNTFAGYIFKDDSQNTILNVNTATQDVVANAFVAVGNISLTRDGNGEIASMTKHNRTWIITRDGNGEIASLTDGFITKTITRDGDGALSGIVVT